MDKRLEKIENYIRQYHMIEKGDRIIIGVSGGADSVCLLMALCSLQEKLGFQVLVCHVNHELRGEEAAQDEAYVEMLCHKMQVPFFAFHENVELIAKKRKESLEEAGRYVRRQAFEQLCREQGGTKIATAHHSNDNAETMLLNMARGTGLRGLCGICLLSISFCAPATSLTDLWISNFFITGSSCFISSALRNISFLL